MTKKTEDIIKEENRMNEGRNVRSNQMAKVTGGAKKAEKEHKKAEFLKYCDAGYSLMDIINKTGWRINTIVIYMLETSRMPMLDGEFDRDEIRNHISDIEAYDKSRELKKKAENKELKEKKLRQSDPDWWLNA